MNIGEKIRILREIKSISPKQMADSLDLTLGGYQKIERGEVDINTERLKSIADLLEVKPTDLLSEDKVVVQFSNNDLSDGSIQAVINTIQLPSDISKLYTEHIELLKEQILLLKETIRTLESELSIRKN